MQLLLDSDEITPYALTNEDIEKLREIDDALNEFRSFDRSPSFLRHKYNQSQCDANYENKNENDDDKDNYSGVIGENETDNDKHESGIKIVTSDCIDERTVKEEKGEGKDRQMDKPLNRLFGDSYLTNQVVTSVLF